MRNVWNFILENSLLLVFGAVLAVTWANLGSISYINFREYVLIDDFFIGHRHFGEDGEIHRTLTLHFLINDLGMAFFFAVAGKEIWEAIILKDGSLRGKKSFTPLIATLGGMLGPIMVYLGVAYLFGSTTFEAIKNGWAIPTATDIAFSYLIGRMIFGAKHPAVEFLLLLAIADDALGLIILAIFYPSADLVPLWLLLSLTVAVVVYSLFNFFPTYIDGKNINRPCSTWVRNKLGAWPYIIAGAVSWYAFHKSGLHPALGLLPIIPTIPHAERDFGIFINQGNKSEDLLNSIEHSLKSVVAVILFFFGLLNAGVEFSAVSEATYAVLFGLLIGKPLGIFIFGFVGSYVLNFGLAKGMNNKDLFTLGCISAIGFTVSLFVASVAFVDGEIQDTAKMGALLSFLAAPIAIIVAKFLSVQKVNSR